LLRPDVPAKPAVVVGLAQAQAARSSHKRASEKLAAQRVAAPPPPPQPPQLPPPPPARSRQMNAVSNVVPNAAPPNVVPPNVAPTPRRSAAMNAIPRAASSVMPSVSPHVVPSAAAHVVPAQPRRSASVPVPAPFGDEPTRQVDDELLAALRNAPPAKPSPRPSAIRPSLPRPSAIRPAAPDEPTRMGPIDEFDGPGSDEMTRPADDFPPRFLSPAPTTEPELGRVFEDHRELDEATRLASLDGMAAMERARSHGPPNDERTRAVNIRNDPSISDIDWDLD
jgi:hypothetical protein